MTILIPSRRPSLPPGRLKAGANPHYSLYKQIIGIKICPSKIKYEWWRLRAWRGEWKEFEDAVQEKELTRALRLLESLEYEDLELNNVGSSPSRNWEILDTCLNCQDMELVARSFQFLYDRGFLPNFGKFKNTVIKGARNVTPAVLKDLTGVEASKFAPKKWGISGSSTLVSLASLAGISFLVNNGIDIRPKLAIILGLGVFDAVYLGGSLLAQILSIWPPYKRRIIVHEAGHLLIAYLLGCPIRGVILEPWKAMQMGIQGQAGTQFWDKTLESELCEGRLTSASFDRYCMILFAGIAAETLIYGDAEGGESDENLFKAIVSLLRPPWSTAQMSNQARWAVMQSYNLLKENKHAHKVAVKTLEKTNNLGYVIRKIEGALDAGQ
ncbi:hypothetical protein SUGI_0397520 [Cryptomeria japonica]|nr:hypothetical protein SUGI_0397520 [Cryptomeria japonica]